MRITRRDFLNGTAVGAGTSLLAPAELLAQVDPIAPGDSSAHYPPTLTGMRGSHGRSFEVAHALLLSGDGVTSSALTCDFRGKFVCRNSATQGCVSDDERRCPRYSKRFGEKSDLL